MIRYNKDLTLVLRDRGHRAWARNYYRELRQGQHPFYAWGARDAVLRQLLA